MASITDPTGDATRWQTNSSNSLVGDSATQTENTTTDQWLADISRQTVDFLQNVTDTNDLRTNSESPEVTIKRPDVLESDIGTAEKVVIGALIIVAILAVIAIILRLCRPRCYSKADKQSESENIEKSFGIVDSDSKLSGYTNFGLEVASNSSGSSDQSKDWSHGNGSNPSTDWSDLSDVSKSTDQSNSDTYLPKKEESLDRCIPAIACRHGPHGAMMKRYASDDRLLAKCAPHQSRRQINDEEISVKSTHSLDPRRLEHMYQTRWTEHWDPYDSIPRSNLSQHSRPSGSHLSLNSFSSHSSNQTFPIPSRDTVKQMHVDISSRYPAGSAKVHHNISKDKHIDRVPNKNRSR